MTSFDPKQAERRRRAQQVEIRISGLETLRRGYPLASTMVLALAHPVMQPDGNRVVMSGPVTDAWRQWFFDAWVLMHDGQPPPTLPARTVPCPTCEGGTRKDAYGGDCGTCGGDGRIPVTKP